MKSQFQLLSFALVSIFITRHSFADDTLQKAVRTYYVEWSGEGKLRERTFLELTQKKCWVLQDADSSAEESKANQGCHEFKPVRSKADAASFDPTDESTTIVVIKQMNSGLADIQLLKKEVGVLRRIVNASKFGDERLIAQTLVRLTFN